jgi:hypothetical protein
MTVKLNSAQFNGYHLRILMTGPDFDPEKLRPAEYLHEPDPRNALTAWCDENTGVIRPVQPVDLHNAVAALTLHPAVPLDIVQHFETVKNVYLYSWFIYRFQPVAEMQSLACLEYALRVRLAAEILAGKLKAKRPGLQKLMRYAIDNQLVKNEGFARWVQAQDPEWDLLRSLESALPQIRNDYAHGSYSLTPTALGIIELVHEIISQLFTVTTS